MIPADTSPAAFSVQALLFRRLGRDERLRRALEMCDEMRTTCADGVRRRHPEWGDRQVGDEVRRIVLDLAPHFE